MEKLLEIMLLLTCSVFCKHEDVHVFKTDCQQIEELYLNESSVILNIPQHMRTQQTQICTFKYKFKGLKLLKVSMDNKHKENCTFDIELRTGIRDRPVTVSCRGSRESQISWPWSIVYLSVNFINSDIDSSNKFITFELYASNTSIEMPNADKQYITINIPSGQYDRCLDSSTKNYRILTSFQKSIVPVMHEICLNVVDSTEVCIRTETKMFNKSYSVCPLKMNVQMSKSNLITLRCQDINHFWCLPWRLTGKLYFIWTLLESLNASLLQDRKSLLYISIQSTLPSTTSGEIIDASLNTGHPDQNGIQNKSSYTDTLHKIISPLAACLTVGIIACLVVCARYKGQYGFMRAASQQSINMSSSTVEESFDRSQASFNVNTSDFVNSIPPYYYYVYQMNKSMFPFPKEPPPSYPEVTGQSYPEVTGQPYPEVTGQPYPEVIAGHTYPEEEPPPYDVALRMIAQESRTDTET